MVDRANAAIPEVDQDLGIGDPEPGLKSNDERPRPSVYRDRVELASGKKGCEVASVSCIRFIENADSDASEVGGWSRRLSGYPDYLGSGASADVTGQTGGNQFGYQSLLSRRLDPVGPTINADEVVACGNALALSARVSYGVKNHVSAPVEGLDGLGVDRQVACSLLAGCALARSLTELPSHRASARLSMLAQIDFGRCDSSLPSLHRPRALALRYA